jgi:hypothetical protein
LQGNDELANAVGYTSNPDQYSRYRVVIRPSGFFESESYGKKSSIPALPLKKIDNTEISFGNDRVEQKGSTVFVEADIVASSFFFLSRYEEFVRDDCFDQHNRFEGKKSLQFKAGFINRPIVDEYGILLRKWLRKAGMEVKEPNTECSKVYLTHDVDVLETYRHFRGFWGGVCRGNFRNVINSLSSITKDCAFTFDWLINQDLKIKDAEKLFFIKASKGGREFDYPQYNLFGKDFRFLLNLIKKNNCKTGLHTSYYSYDAPYIVEDELDRLSNATNQKISCNRTHFLRILPPNLPQTYTKSRITDDFSVGFADIAGFRLGTSRAVNWINPQTFEIEPVILHPLTLMDVSLSNKNYMNLPCNEAFTVAKNIIHQTKKHNGELVLLWHNTSIAANSNSYHQNLYSQIIDFMRDGL